MVGPDQYWMQRALEQARLAEAQGEVPIGGVLIDSQGEALSHSYNAPITQCDPTAHAEIRLIRQAGELLSNYRLLNTTLYVTLEPCVMCLGAIIHARVQRLVFGAYDPKTGAVTSRWQGVKHPVFNHEIDYKGGVMADSCGDMLRHFFRQRR